jgi:hypothetical protein
MPDLSLQWQVRLPPYILGVEYVNSMGYDSTREDPFARAGFVLGLEIGEKVAEEIVEHSARSSESSQAEAKVREIFKTLIGPLSSLEKGLFWDQMSMAATTESIETFRRTRGSVLGARSLIDEVAPDIAADLFELVNLLDGGTGGTWEDSAFRECCSSNSSVPSLVSSLTRLIGSWLSEHG